MEALLVRGAAVIITRDGKPIVRLVRLRQVPWRRTCFDPKTHARWQEGMSRGRVVGLLAEFLTPGRDAR